MEKTIEYINIGYVSLLSIYHVFTGVISMFFPNFAFYFYKKFYGCDPLSKDMLVIVLKPWGALSIFAGIMGLFAVYDPERYIGVIVSLVLLLFLRIYYRLFFEKDLYSKGKISPLRNRINVSLLFIGCCILISWLIRIVF